MVGSMAGSGAMASGGGFRDASRLVALARAVIEYVSMPVCTSSVFVLGL
jgi:hypothetical protein